MATRYALARNPRAIPLPAGSQVVRLGMIGGLAWLAYRLAMENSFGPAVQKGAVDIHNALSGTKLLINAAGKAVVDVTATEESRNKSGGTTTGGTTTGGTTQAPAGIRFSPPRDLGKDYPGQGVDGFAWDGVHAFTINEGADAGPATTAAEAIARARAWFGH